jgi:glc operon protein GlcG
MNPVEVAAAAHQLIAEIEKLIPAAMQNPEDRDNSQGNVTLMIIAEDGRIFGRMFGTENRVRRGTSRIAWQKATQVWMTAQATGQFEKQVYGGAQIDPGRFGLQHPDLIGWEGGLPVVAADGTKLSVAMSGFSGKTDCNIIRSAVAHVPGLSMA